MSEDIEIAPPKSLGGHRVEPQALERIRVHVDRLSETALRVSEDLPLAASAGDVFRVLDQE